MKKLLLILLAAVLFSFTAIRVVLNEKEANQAWRQLNEVRTLVDNADMTNHGNVKYVILKIDSIRQLISNNIDTTGKK